MTYNIHLGDLTFAPSGLINDPVQIIPNSIPDSLPFFHLRINVNHNQLFYPSGILYRLVTDPSGGLLTVESNATLPYRDAIEEALRSGPQWEWDNTNPTYDASFSYTIDDNPDIVKIRLEDISPDLFLITASPSTIGHHVLYILACILNNGINPSDIIIKFRATNDTVEYFNTIITNALYNAFSSSGMQNLLLETYVNANGPVLQIDEESQIVEGYFLPTNNTRGMRITLRLRNIGVSFTTYTGSSRRITIDYLPISLYLA